MRKYMTQALVRESIARIEDAARTDKEFEELVDLWDKLDKKTQEAFEKTVWSTDSEQFNVCIMGLNPSPFRRNL